jgi:hypothetical protein
MTDDRAQAKAGGNLDITILAHAAVALGFPNGTPQTWTYNSAPTCKYTCGTSTGNWPGLSVTYYGSSEDNGQPEAGGA